MNQKAWDHIDQLDNEFFNELRDKYIPASGTAEKVGGEIIRAMDRLIYRYYNDGDMVGVDYGNETCNSSHRYLCRKLGEKMPVLTCVPNEDAYVDALASLADEVKAFIEKNIKWVFEAPNTEDSRTPDPEDYEWCHDEEEDEYEEDEY